MGCEDCTFGFIITGRGAKKCACKTKVESLHRLQQAAIPTRYTNCTLENYIPQGPVTSAFFTSQSKALRTSTELNSLLLQGPPGTGKTHLAVGMLRKLIENGATGYFCDLTDLLAQRSPDLEPVMKADAVVLDELGSSRLTAWTQDLLTRIINHRHAHNLTTIGTTNYLDAAEPFLIDRIGERLRSRLHELCPTVEIMGADYRVNRAA